MEPSALHPTPEVFESESAAIAYVQSRVWPNGPICPRCGAMNRAREASAAFGRREEFVCGSCHQGFLLRSGTIFEGNVLELSVWLKMLALAEGDVAHAEAWLTNRLDGMTRQEASAVMEGVRNAVRGRDISQIEFRTGPYKVQVNGLVIEADTLEESRNLEDEVVARMLC